MSGRIEHDFVASNAIERIHLEAINKFGHDPTGFTFEAQLPWFRNQSSHWNADIESFMRSLASFSLSRFELIELLPFYYHTARDIRTMQQMSADRLQLPDAQFAIATDPAWSMTSSIDDSVSNIVELDHARYRIVWMNVGMVFFLRSLAQHFVWTLVRPAGSLPDLLDVIAMSGADPQFLVTALLNRRFDAERYLANERDPFTDASRNFNPPELMIHSEVWTAPLFAPLPDSEKGLELWQAVIHRAIMTFVAGHEIGHVFIGHTHSEGRIPVLAGPALSEIDASIVREAEADIVGMTTVWDGMANADPTFFAPIDLTWIGPVVCLASRVGLSSAALDLEDEQSPDPGLLHEAESWRHRLFALIRGLVLGLQRAGFGAERVGRVAACAPPIAAAVVEWILLETHSRSAGKGRMDMTLFEDLRSMLSDA